jgi:hypothetical protein
MAAKIIGRKPNLSRCTNKEYTQTESFQDAAVKVAELLGEENPNKFITVRQASKFRRGTGIVYQTIHNL